MRETMIQNEIFKLKREIQTHGTSFTVYKDVLDEYGQPTEEHENVCDVKGLYYTTNVYQSRSSNYGTTTRARLQPMILAMYNDCKDIAPGMFVFFNNKRFDIVSVNDVSQYNVVCDITLEVVDDGISN